MTSLLSNSRRPDVTFYSNGTIDISARIAKQLALADGDVIDVLHNNGEYLLYIRHKKSDIIGRYEGTVHPINNSKAFTNRFRVNSRKLAEAIFKAAGKEHAKVLHLPAGLHVTVEGYGTAIPLITRNPL